MNGFDVASCVATAVLLAPGSYAANASGTLTFDACGLIGRGSLTAIIGAVTAGAVMTVTLEHSDLVGAGYTAVVPSAQVVANDTKINSIARVGVNAADLKRFIRVSYTVTGTTPSVTCGVAFSAFTSVR